MRLHFDGKNIDIQQLTFTVGDSDMRLSGSITNWVEAPRVQLVVQSPPDRCRLAETRRSSRLVRFRFIFRRRNLVG